MTPEQHREQATLLLAEARESVAVSGDPKSPSYEKRMRFAELAAHRAIAHALLGGPVPEAANAIVERPPTVAELLARDDSQAAHGGDVDGGTP